MSFSPTSLHLQPSAGLAGAVAKSSEHARNLSASQDSNGKGFSVVSVNDSNYKSAATSRRSRQMDSHWVRVMENKENQWRLLHTTGLHETGCREHSAYAELDVLSSRLDQLVNSCDRMERVVKRCRAQRFRQQLIRLSTKPVQKAACHLNVARYLALANRVVDSENGKAMRCCGDQMIGELSRFQKAAERFKVSATHAGILQITLLTDVLEKLAATVASESSAVMDFDTQVSKTGREAENGHYKVPSDVGSFPRQAT